MSSFFIYFVELPKYIIFGILSLGLKSGNKESRKGQKQLSALFEANSLLVKAGVAAKDEPSRN